MLPGSGIHVGVVLKPDGLKEKYILASHHLKSKLHLLDIFFRKNTFSSNFSVTTIVWSSRYLNWAHPSPLFGTYIGGAKWRQHLHMFSAQWQYSLLNMSSIVSSNCLLNSDCNSPDSRDALETGCRRTTRNREASHINIPFRMINSNTKSFAFISRTAGKYFRLANTSKKHVVSRLNSLINWAWPKEMSQNQVRRQKSTAKQLGSMLIRSRWK